MEVKAIQPRNYLSFTYWYKGELTQVVQSFKYLGINVPSTSGMYAMSSNFKWVGIGIIYLRFNLAKVILKVDKWDWCCSMLWWTNCCLMEWTKYSGHDIEKIQILLLHLHLGVKFYHAIRNKCSAHKDIKMMGIIYIHIMSFASSLKMSIEPHNLLKCICFLKITSTLRVKLSYWPHNVWISNNQNSAIIIEASWVTL